MARTNSFSIRGFVGKDAEVKALASGKQLAQFSLCVEERWQAADGQTVSKKEWFKLLAWGRQAEIAAERVRKGTLLEAHGRLENRSWIDSAGQKHYTIDLVVRELVFIDRSTGQPIEEPTPSSQPEEPAAAPEPTPEQAEPAPERTPRRRKSA
jgi:single-strand DNA-binding protein